MLHSCAQCRRSSEADFCGFSTPHLAANTNAQPPTATANGKGEPLESVSGGPPDYCTVVGESVVNIMLN